MKSGVVSDSSGFATPPAIICVASRFPDGGACRWLYGRVLTDGSLGRQRIPHLEPARPGMAQNLGPKIGLVIPLHLRHGEQGRDEILSPSRQGIARGILVFL